MGGQGLLLPIAMIQHREIMLTGTYRYVNTWPIAIDLIASGAIEVRSLITGRFGIDDIEKTDPTSIQSMIIPALMDSLL